MAFDLSKMRRDPERVGKALVREGGSLKTKEDLTVVVPQYLATGNLGSVGESVRATGYAGYFLADGSFACDSVPAVLTFAAAPFRMEVIDDETYLVIEYPAGSTVMDSVTLVQSATLCYDIYNLFLARGKHPFYFNQLTRSIIFDGAEHYAGMSLEADHAILELMAAYSIRDPSDVTTEKRTTIKTMADLTGNDYAVIPQRSVALGVADALGKMTGSYQREGLTGALAAPTDTAELLDEILTT